MTDLEENVYAKMEDIRTNLAELHYLLKEYHRTFFSWLNVIDNQIDDFRKYFTKCSRKGLIKHDDREPLPDAERIAAYIRESIPKSRQFDVLLWLASSYPPKGTFSGGFKL
ncbi:MAG: hypothetical protein PHV59_01770 [Victivallales bacterium]|nr:hypothetical protein [Victivallales bacterium]